LFLLSFGYRNELVACLETAGWLPIAARRGEGAERRFLSSGALIAVIDGRGAFDEAVAATMAVSDAVEANGAALVVLLSADDQDRLPEMFAAGATHYLVAPFSEQELIQLLRFASRYVMRLGGGEAVVRQRAALLADAEQWWRWIPETDSIELSPALAFRFPDAPRNGRMLLRSVDATGRAAAARALKRLRRSGVPTAFAHDFDGFRLVHHLRREQGGAIFGHVEDIGHDARIFPVETRDPLTGLGDRQAVLGWIEDVINSPDRDRPCILLLISINRFDSINEAFGRSTGDALLRAVGRRIVRLVSGYTSRRYMIARLAGGEFAVGLIGHLGEGEASLIANHLSVAVSRPFVSASDVVGFSCRVGGTTVERSDGDAALVLRRASAALAEAKASDRAVPRLLDSSGHAETQVASQLEIDLRSALERDEIRILFQPQLSITTGALVGVEALARWEHPTLGELGAEPLFAAAIRSDYLLPLSQHVQRKALAIAGAQPEIFGSLCIAINVTAADITEPNFASWFLRMVDEAGVERRHVTVEITESGLIADLADAAMLLATLRGGGLKVAIDDFGTGYSSLAYLKALPLDYLKIDSQLSRDIVGTPRARVVVTGVIEMARSLGLGVVAEGVETEEQLSVLAAAGCNIYQGFIYSPPVPASELAKLVARDAR